MIKIFKLLGENPRDMACITVSTGSYIFIWEKKWLFDRRRKREKKKEPMRARDALMYIYIYVAGKTRIQSNLEFD